MCGHNFNAGELGPGTIVGSAAFNMFVIIGLCVWVIPDGESRKIKHLRVFFITAFWSIFAYIWLYLILAVISPGIVEVCFKLILLGSKNLENPIQQRFSYVIPELSMLPGVGGCSDAALLSCMCYLGLDC